MSARATPALRVQRVDAPWPGLLALTVRQTGATEVLLIARAPANRGVGVVTDRPRGLPASSFVMRLRRELEGARLLGVERGTRGPRVALARGEERLFLIVPERRDSDPLVLADSEGRVVAAEGAPGEAPLQSGAPFTPIPWEALRAAGPPLAASLTEQGLERLRTALRASGGRALGRLDRTLSAVEGDAARADAVPQLRRDGAALLAQLHDLTRNTRELRYHDWESDPPVERVVALDPALGPRAQAERWFARARRLERGAKIAAERWAMLSERRERLEDLLRAIGSASDRAQLEALIDRAGALEVFADARERRPGRRRTPRLPYRRFVSGSGVAILVGRGAADNDALTLRHSRPHDLWLHARGVAGAHVIVSLDRHAGVPPELLIDAATLAAHFSEARGQDTVDVSYTPRRYVHKRRGTAIGQVTLEREKVVAVRMQSDRLARLLASEQRLA